MNKKKKAFLILCITPAMMEDGGAVVMSVPERMGIGTRNSGWLIFLYEMNPVVATNIPEGSMLSPSDPGLATKTRSFDVQV